MKLHLLAFESATTLFDSLIADLNLKILARGCMRSLRPRRLFLPTNFTALSCYTSTHRHFMSARLSLHSVGRSMHYERGFLTFLAAICTIGLDHKNTSARLDDSSLLAVDLYLYPNQRR